VNPVPETFAATFLQNGKMCRFVEASTTPRTRFLDPQFSKGSKKEVVGRPSNSSLPAGRPVLVLSPDTAPVKPST
jgi:hypothetical protein